MSDDDRIFDGKSAQRSRKEFIAAMDSPVPPAPADARELVRQIFEIAVADYWEDRAREAETLITTYATAHGEKRWREGMLTAAKEVCDACDNEERYGPAHKIQGSTRWWHGDDNVPCQAGGVHALLNEEKKDADNNKTA